MKKKGLILVGLISIIFLSGCTGDNVDNPVEAEASCFEYKTNSTGITITKFSCGSFDKDLSDGKYKHVIIPSVIDGYTVTEIGRDAFNNTNGDTGTYISSVVIPDGVTSIGDYAFYNNNLKSVTIPSSVTSIGRSAFYNNNLESVVIPDGVTSIGDSAFNSNDLESITIPSSVTTIADYTFYNNNLKSVTISSGVTTIGDYAFYDNNLKSVTIPSSVTTIGDYAFYGNRFTSVTIKGKDRKSDFNSFGVRVFDWDLSYNETKIIWD